MCYSSHNGFSTFYVLLVTKNCLTRHFLENLEVEGAAAADLEEFRDPVIPSDIISFGQYGITSYDHWPFYSEEDALSAIMCLPPECCEDCDRVSNTQFSF